MPSAGRCWRRSSSSAGPNAAAPNASRNGMRRSARWQASRRRHRSKSHKHTGRRRGAGRASRMVVAMIETLLAWDRKLARLLVWVGGAGLLFAAVMVSVDVVLRDLFATTIGGAEEISGYIFAVSTAFALPYRSDDQ